jgi:hypothetical protein
MFSSADFTGFPPRGRWVHQHTQQTPGGDLNGGFRKGSVTTLGRFAVR